MLGRSLVGLLVLGLALSGCVVKVYQKEMPRKDIVVEGNQGYLVGAPPKQGYTVEKKTRKILVTEIELVNPKELDIRYLGEKKAGEGEENVDQESEKEMNYGYIYRKEPIEEEFVEEGGVEEVPVVEEEEVVPSEEAEEEEEVKGKEEYVIYKVQKGDTLQKISYKFYGKYSLWPKIFEANKDKLENPNSIYVGQELRIPVLNEGDKGR